MNLVTYVRQKPLLPSQGWFSASTGGQWKLFSEMFMTTSYSFAFCYERGDWVETSEDLFPCKRSCDTLLGFPSLSPTARAGPSHLARSVDQGQAVGSQAREWLKVYHCLRPSVQLFTCPSPWPYFSPSLLHHLSDFFLFGALAFAQMAVTLASLLVTNSWKQGIKNVYLLIIKILFYLCYALGRAVSELHQMSESLLTSILKLLVAFFIHICSYTHLLA